MNIKDFLSDHPYVILPTKTNPKVYLPIADARTVKRAFELYNPFSQKAKLLKRVAHIFCRWMKPIARVLLPTVTGGKSKLIISIEKQLSKSITSSAYLATAKDKVVLQLQDNNGIIGYLKYPISDLGKERLLNEKTAIELLSEKKLISSLVSTGEFENTPFIILKPIEGEIGSVSKEEYTAVLNSFKREESYLLKSHPRVIAIRKQLVHLNFSDLNDALEQTLSLSKKEYSVVYEHGDFAPWNLIKTADDIVPFDFEYFDENGLEHLDELKFHFQELTLLHQKKGKSLISSIASKVDFEEFDCIFQLFLLKEIINKTKSGEIIETELSLLKQLR